MYTIFLLFLIVSISADENTTQEYKLKWPPKNKAIIDITVVEGSDINLDCNRYEIDYIEGCPYIKWTRYETDTSGITPVRTRAPIMNSITNENKYPYLCVEGSRLCKIDTYLDMCTKPVLNLRNLMMNDTNKYQCTVLVLLNRFETYTFDVKVIQDTTVQKKNDASVTSSEKKVIENTSNNSDKTNSREEVNGVLNNIGKKFFLQNKKNTKENKSSNDNSIIPDKNTDSSMTKANSKLIKNRDSNSINTHSSEVVPSSAGNSDGVQSISPILADGATANPSTPGVTEEVSDMLTSPVNETSTPVIDGNGNLTQQKPQIGHSKPGQVGALRSEESKLGNYWWLIFPVLVCAVLFIGIFIKRQNSKNTPVSTDAENGENIPFNGHSINGEDMKFMKPMGTHGLIANDRKVTIVPPPHHKSIAPIIAGRPSVVPPKRRSTMKPVDPRRPSSVGSMFNEGDSYDESAESIREALSNIIMSKKSYAELFTSG